jgi:hypothetical protein
MECLHDNAILVGTVSDLFLPSRPVCSLLIRPSTQPSHPILAKNGLCTRHLLPPRSKTNTSRNGNGPCCENYNRPQRLWLPAKLFRKLIKSCFTRCVRAAARLPAAHLAGPASEGLPGSPRPASPLHAASGLPPRRARPASPLRLPAARRARLPALGLASPPREACLPAAHGARPATPPRAACLPSARFLTPRHTPRAACLQYARGLPPHRTPRAGLAGALKGC